MSIVNGKSLLAAAPLDPMLDHKARAHGVSHGLSEAGYDLRIRQDVTLTPDNRFTLASTVERFQMPCNLLGLVKDKSTWARQGLSVFNTVVEPGWHGDALTLELVYHGNGELRIPAGAGIAQVLFWRVEEPAQYAGKYQWQGEEPTPAIFDGTEQPDRPVAAIPAAEGGPL